MTDNNNNNTTESNSSNTTGIFILDYKYQHTLNHFLFHIPELLQKVGINICIIPTTNDAIKLPAKLGNLNLINPPSLIKTSKYLILHIEKEDINEKWNLKRIEECSL